MAEKNRVQVTNQQFFQICNELQNKREQIVKECKSRLQVATWMKQKLGIDCSDHCVKNALAAVGVELEKVKVNRVQKGKENAKVISKALYRLYRKLGEEVPADLLEVVMRLNPGMDVNKQTGTPVSKVPDPKSIPVVNK